MAETRESYTIAQFSDVHCGDPRFDAALIEAIIDEVNSLAPDLVAIAGDLTADGYRDQFDQAKSYIDQIRCPQKIIIAGNHDSRNVGFLHFEDIFGERQKITYRLEFGLCCADGSGEVEDRIRILAVDSNKPDLNDGEIGREHYSWIDEEFADEREFKVFMLHHHLVSIPGTGRERNVVLDAGDVLERLKEAKVDLVLCGHRHVPYNWPIAGMVISSSGTSSTWRTRGYIQPSYNIVRVDPESVLVTTKVPGGRISRREKFPRRHAVTAGWERS